MGIKGLPCLLTSFLPGQEEGNIKFVTEAGAGEYVADTEPDLIAATVASWLSCPQRLVEMSQAARSLAKPRAALDIARKICDGLLELGVELTESKADWTRGAPDVEEDDLAWVRVNGATSSTGRERDVSVS